MTLDIFLFMLRILGAVVLLLFMGGLFWLLYNDMQVSLKGLVQQSRPIGSIQILNHENGTPMSYPLMPVTSIGRAYTNIIVLEDEFASNEHALIIRQGEKWLLEDVGSRNGTLLNDIVLAETAVVTPGDIIKIGNTQLKIEAN